MKHYMKLRGKIVEKFGTYANFADAVGISRAMMSFRLNKKINITIEEAYRWADILGISNDEIGLYFFDNEIRK